MKKIIRSLENKQEEIKEENQEIEMNERDLMELVIEEVNSKTLNLVGHFDYKMVAYVREFANQLWYFENDDFRPLYINISSHGGFASDLLAILDILQDLKDEWGCTIITNCNGYAESCGFILWSYGDERYMGKFGEMMCHQISYNYENNLSGHEQELKRTKKMQEKIDRIIMEKTGLTKKILNKWYREGDHFIDKDEALKLNILTPEDDE